MHCAQLARPKKSLCVHLLEDAAEGQGEVWLSCRSDMDRNRRRPGLRVLMGLELQVAVERSELAVVLARRLAAEAGEGVPHEERDLMTVEVERAG